MNTKEIDSLAVSSVIDDLNQSALNLLEHLKYGTSPCLSLARPGVSS